MKILTSALIASQSISPLYFNEYIQPINSELIADWVHGVRRVYCSTKSLGFDLHFNSRSGQLYSFNEFSDRLEPFNIESEIPFKDILPYGSTNEFLYYWWEDQMTIDTNISNGDLIIKFYSGFYPQEYIMALLNISTLELKIDLSRGTNFTREERLIANNIASQIKCEYIEPESYQF